MTSVVDTPQHYIPLGGSSGLNLSYIYEILLNNTSVESRGRLVAGSTTSSGLHGVPFSVIVSVVVAVVVAVLLYLVASRYSGEGVVVAARPGTGLLYSVSPPYRYEGRKRVLRSLFDYLRGKLLGTSGFYEGMTVTEVAALLDSGGVLMRFANIYNAAVFSPREPSVEEIEEAKRLVSAWEDNTTISNGS